MKLSTKDIEFFYSIAADMFPGKDIPKWISEHPAIKDREVKKVFPRIGLPNFKEKVVVPEEAMAPTIHSPKIFAAVISIQKQIVRAEDAVNIAFRTFIDNRNKKLEGDERIQFFKELEIMEKERLHLTRMLEHFGNIVVDPGLVKALPDGRVDFIVVEPLMLGDKLIAKVRETIFKAYNIVKAIVDSYFAKLKLPSIMISIDKLEDVKKFSQQNVPLKQEGLQIIFSSSGTEGAWDIATMSMRGLKSCQKWQNTYQEDHRPCLIGSVASEYVGIIYLTSGKDFEDKGSKMIRRCVVRLAADISEERKKNPVIILDKMYDSYHPVIANLFLEALRKRSKYPVIDASPGNVVELMKNIRLIDEELPEIYDQKPEHGVITGDGPEEGPEFGMRSYRDTEFPYFKDEKAKKEREEEFIDEDKEKVNISYNKNSLESTSRNLNLKFVDIIKKYNLSEEDSSAIDDSFFLGTHQALIKITHNPKIKKRVLSKSFDFVKRFFLSKCLKIQIDTSKISQEAQGLVGRIMEELRDVIMAEIEKTRSK